MRTTLTRGDLLCAAVCLLLAMAALLLPLCLRPVGAELVVTDHHSGKVTVYSLATDRTIELVSADGQHHLTLVIEDGTARIRAADCPDGVCVASGTISRAGQTLVCAPAGITLIVRGEQEDTSDAIVG